MLIGCHQIYMFDTDFKTDLAFNSKCYSPVFRLYNAIHQPKQQVKSIKNSILNLYAHNNIHGPLKQTSSNIMVYQIGNDNYYIHLICNMS